VERAFYYWKSDTYGITEQEKTWLDTLQAHKLYIKFFEVHYDQLMGAIPQAKTNFRYYYYPSSLPSEKLTVIPTVFIDNEVLQRSSKSALDTLADNICYLAHKYYVSNFFYGYDAASGRDSNLYRELQLDCDWTAGTRDNYFYLLRAIRKISHLTISCTLRLYPYKYRDKMGVPPADKVMLMCYNLLNPLSSGSKNSILDNRELEAYLGRRKPYPLHVDLALPVYSWMQCYQNKRFAGIIATHDTGLLQLMKPVRPLWYEMTQDTVVGQLYLRRGDQVKYEQTTPAQLEVLTTLLREHVPLDDTTTVSFFHLDETELKRFSYETLDHLYRNLLAD